MATIHFYEKPGCLNNTRQKQMLREAGHLLVVYDLLQQTWADDPAKLRSFFGDTPVADWFNRSAPAIKNGEITPEAVSEEHAIELMIAMPLLIRRPLLEVDGRRQAGFDPEKIEVWLGLPANPQGPDLETCPKQQDKKGCKP
jgi:nitrogenase-associated protein